MPIAKLQPETWAVFERTPHFLEEKRGWVERGRWVFGYYRTRYGSFEGKVRKRLLQVGDFYLRFPPPSLAKHSHWRCFHQRGEGWYEIHFVEKPKSIDDGIKTIERILVEGFQIADRGANEANGTS